MAAHAQDVVPPAARLGVAARRLRSLTNVDVAFTGVDRPGRPWFQLGNVHGGRTGGLDGLAVVRGSGVGGRAMSLARPVAVRDYAGAHSITHQYDGVVLGEGIRAMFAVPAVHRGRVFGMLYGAFRAPVGIGDRVLSTASDIVREVEGRIAVDESVSRRLAEIERARVEAEPPDEASVARERLREIQAELLEIACTSSDPGLRERLQRISRELVGGPPAESAPQHGRRALLTVRELDVLVQAAVGCSNREIGTRLSILPTTVKSYLQSAMRKLGAANRVEAVCAARRLGLIP